MKSRRVERVNSLLREVITEVIQREVKNPHLPAFISVSHIEVSQDLQHAKVYVTVLGDEKAKERALEALTSAAGFIASKAAKKVTLRYFPELLFRLDDSIEKQLKIHNLITDIENERSRRPEHESNE